jgi:predicted nucleotidyltransferase
MAEQTSTDLAADSILDFLNSHAAELRAMGVQRIGLLGSYVRGDQQPDSDVDFLFEMEHLTWTGWMDIWNFLEDGLGVEVDLVPKKDLRPELSQIVLSEVRYAEDF